MARRFLTVPEAAEHRRAIRRYTGESIPLEDIREILRLASLAPSPDNVQPWRLIVARDQSTKDALEAASYGNTQIGNADTVFVLYSDLEDVIAHAEEVVHPGFGDQAPARAERIRKNFTELGDLEERAKFAQGLAYIFLGFLLLTVESFGYASSPMLGFDPEKVKAMFNLPAHVRISALLAIGVKGEEGFPHHRHSVDRIARFV